MSDHVINVLQQQDACIKLVVVILSLQKETTARGEEFAHCSSEVRAKSVLEPGPLDYKCNTHIPQAPSCCVI